MLTSCCIDTAAGAAAASLSGSRRGEDGRTENEDNSRGDDDDGDYSAPDGRAGRVSEVAELKRKKTHALPMSDTLRARTQSQNSVWNLLSKDRKCILAFLVVGFRTFVIRHSNVCIVTSYDVTILRYRNIQ